MNRVLAVFAIVAWAGLSGCAAPPPEERIAVTQGEIDLLATELAALGPGVDSGEAARAAEIAYRHSRQLAIDYQVTDPAVVHNAKVHRGTRTRGLCNHYTEDMTNRLAQENFATLELHWAISPPTPLRIIHHSVVISSKGDTLDNGIVIDPWRHGGNLFWARTVDDRRYNWRPRMEVRAELIAARKAQEAKNAEIKARLASRSPN